MEERIDEREGIWGSKEEAGRTTRIITPYIYEDETDFQRERENFQRREREL